MPETDLVIEAEIEDDPDAENLPVQDYAGVVTRIEDLSATIKGIWARLAQPIRFQAGQYLNLDLPDGIGSRPFSIANAPGDGQEVELNVRIVPGGLGTAYLHHRLQVDDELTISGPYGRFFVRKSADLPMIFMAGGSGLASPRSMILDLLAEGCGLSITLVYGQRTRDELYYHEQFVELAREHGNFTYVPVLSEEPDDSGWDGARGFVHEQAKQVFGNDFRGHKAYLCGPPLMVESCITTLMQGRLFEKDIYTEKFISAADAQQVRSPLFKAL